MSILDWRDFMKLPFADFDLPQYVVAKGYNTLEHTEWLFGAEGNNTSLWPKAITFEKLKMQDNLSLNGDDTDDSTSRSS